MVAVILLYASWQMRRRSLLLAAGAVVALIGVYFLLDYFVETDREQVRRSLLDIADGVKDDRPNRIISHISAQFSVQGKDKAAFESYLEPRLSQHWLDELVIWDIAFPVGDPPPAEGTLLVTFSARPKSKRLGQTPWFRCESVFVRDPDRQWRMNSFELFEAVSGSRSPVRAAVG